MQDFASTPIRHRRTPFKTPEGRGIPACSAGILAGGLSLVIFVAKTPEARKEALHHAFASKKRAR